MSDRIDEIISETIALFSREEDRKYLSDFFQRYRDRIVTIKTDVQKDFKKTLKSKRGKIRVVPDKNKKDFIGIDCEKTKNLEERSFLFMAPSLYSIRNAEDFYLEIAGFDFAWKPVEREKFWILAEISFSDSETEDFTGVLRLRSSDGTIWFKPPLEEEFQVAVNFADMVNRSLGMFVSVNSEKLDLNEEDLDKIFFTKDVREAVRHCFCHEDPDEVMPYYIALHYYVMGNIFSNCYLADNSRSIELDEYFHYQDLALEFPPRRLEAYCRPGPGTEGAWYQFGFVYSRGLEENCSELLLVDPVAGRFAILRYCKTLFSRSYFQECRRSFFPGLIPSREMTFGVIGGITDLFQALDRHSWLDPVPVESRKVPVVVVERPVLRKFPVFISFLMGFYLLGSIFAAITLLLEVVLVRGEGYSFSDNEVKFHLFMGVILAGIVMVRFYLMKIKNYFVIQPEKNMVNYCSRMD